MENKNRFYDLNQTYSIIRNNIEMGMQEKWKTLMITSPTLIEGQHMIAINIASLLSKEGKKVLLLTNTQNKSFSKIKQLVDQKQSDYDYILFFSADYLNNVDMQRLTATCDGVVLVLQEKVTKKEDMKKVKMLLQKSKTDLIGIIYKKAPKVRVNRFFGKGRKAVES